MLISKNKWNWKQFAENVGVDKSIWSEHTALAEVWPLQVSHLLLWKKSNRKKQKRTRTLLTKWHSEGHGERVTL